MAEPAAPAEPAEPVQPAAPLPRVTKEAGPASGVPGFQFTPPTAQQEEVLSLASSLEPLRSPLETGRPPSRDRRPKMQVLGWAANRPRMHPKDMGGDEGAADEAEAENAEEDPADEGDDDGDADPGDAEAEGNEGDLWWSGAGDDRDSGNSGGEDYFGEGWEDDDEGTGAEKHRDLGVAQVMSLEDLARSAKRQAVRALGDDETAFHALYADVAVAQASGGDLALSDLFERATLACGHDQYQAQQTVFAIQKILAAEAGLREAESMAEGDQGSAHEKLPELR